MSKTPVSITLTTKFSKNLAYALKSPATNTGSSEWLEVEFTGFSGFAWDSDEQGKVFIKFINLAILLQALIIHNKHIWGMNIKYHSQITP